MMAASNFLFSALAFLAGSLLLYELQKTNWFYNRYGEKS